MGLIDFVGGRCIISTSKKNSSKLIELCMKTKSEYWHPHFFDDRFVIECHTHTLAKLRSACEKRKIEISVVSRRGLPYILSQYRDRVGLLVGTVISVLLMFFAFNVVWRIEISGNGEISSERIEQLLAENDFSIGTVISSADLTLIENRVMQSEKGIAWISVNMNGTVANVEVRETRKGEERAKTPIDLVAVRDGKIERIEAYNGNCLVKVGDVVRAGDVLVSGTYPNEEGNYRVVRAEGEIFARTVREILIEVPFENFQKVYTGRYYSEIYVNFFKKSIKVFANTGNLPPTCDIIYKNTDVGFSELPKVPISVEKTTYSEYIFKPVVLDETEAMNKAFELLAYELSRFSQNTEMLKKDIDFEITDSGYFLKCRVVCVENIAVARESK